MEEILEQQFLAALSASLRGGFVSATLPGRSMASLILT
jgi:hypothetical protein